MEVKVELNVMGFVISVYQKKQNILFEDSLSVAFKELKCPWFIVLSKYENTIFVLFELL